MVAPLKLADTSEPATSARDRQEVRVKVLIRTVKLLAGERELVGILLDVSRTGMQLKLFKGLPEGQPLAIELEDHQRLPVSLVWRKGDHAGFSFDQPVDLDQLINPGDGRKPHRQVRLRFCTDGRITADGVSHPMRFENVSQCGARCECEAYLAIGQLVRIETDDLAPHYAKVRWRSRPSYGLVFEDVLNMGELVQLISADLPDAAAALPLTA